MYQRTEHDGPLFRVARAPTVEQLDALLAKNITRLMRLLTRQGILIDRGNSLQTATAGSGQC